MNGTCVHHLILNTLGIILGSNVHSICCSSLLSLTIKTICVTCLLVIWVPDTDVTWNGVPPPFRVRLDRVRSVHWPQTALLYQPRVNDDDK
jgi:hypothetical protein